LATIGRTIDKIGNVQKNTAEEERAENVMVVITTDGMENASREYRYDKIKAMIEQQKEKYGWDFLFIGANIDAIETAGRFGITPDHAVDYCADSRGTRKMYESIGLACSMKRMAMPVKADWKQDIEEDYEGRKNPKQGILSRLRRLAK